MPGERHRGGDASSASDTVAAVAGRGARAVVPWFPSWAREFAEQYFAGTTCLFVLHGNVHDLTLQEAGKERTLRQHHRLPGDAALRHLGRRLAARPEPGAADRRRARRRAAAADGRPPQRADRRAEVVAARSRTRSSRSWISLIQGILMEVDPAKRISVGIILDHAQYLVPTSELSQMAGSLGHAAGAAAVVGAEPLHQAE